MCILTHKMCILTHKFAWATVLAMRASRRDSLGQKGKSMANPNRAVCSRECVRLRHLRGGHRIEARIVHGAVRRNPPSSVPVEHAIAPPDGAHAGGQRHNTRENATFIPQCDWLPVCESPGCERLLET
jgi:hypothetical protein